MAPAEAARDPRKLRGPPRKAPPQRAPALVVEAAHAGRRILEVERIFGRVGHVDAGREDPAEAPLPFGRLEPLEQHGEAIPRPDVTREIHFPVVHVSDRPGELTPLGPGRNVSATALSSASYSDDSITPVIRRRVIVQGIVSTVSVHPESPRTSVRRAAGERRTRTRLATLSVFRRRTWNTSPGRSRRTGRCLPAARKRA